MSISYSNAAPEWGNATPPFLPTAPTDLSEVDDVETPMSKAWQARETLRLREYQSIPLCLRQLDRERCWVIACDAVDADAAKGGRG